MRASQVYFIPRSKLNIKRLPIYFATVEKGRVTDITTGVSFSGVEFAVELHLDEAVPACRASPLGRIVTVDAANSLSPRKSSIEPLNMLCVHREKRVVDITLYYSESIPVNPFLKRNRLHTV